MGQPTLKNMRYEKYKPAVAMVVVQCIFTLGTLATKFLLSNGTSFMVFTTYRQGVASLVMLPITLVVRGPRKLALGVRSFSLVFATSFIGCTLFQYFYCLGLQKTSSSMSAAMNNLVPAVTFLIAVSSGLEKVKLRSLRSMSKVLGTIICFGGAVFMAFYQGPKLLGIDFHRLYTILQLPSDQWMVGFIFLTGSTCCGSLWFILQVPICKNYLDPLSLATWVCIMSTIQSGVLTYFLESDPEAWKIGSNFEFFSIIYTAIFASGVNFCLQSWVISVRGPVFCTLFNPVQIIIATMLAFLLLHEELHTGSLIGDVAVIGGLYIVLWGKAGDFEAIGKLDPAYDFAKNTTPVDQQSKDNKDLMKEPLLAETPNDIESQMKS